MMSRTHIAAGITATITLTMITKTHFNYYELVPGAILGSTAPDIDTQKSWASQTIPIVDDYLRKFKILKHRGITHGISGITAAAALYMIIQRDFILGFSLGYIMHCLLDIVTYKRIGVKNDRKVYIIVWLINIVLIVVKNLI